MWTKGVIEIGRATIYFCVKHYDEPSETFGINGGRISKLTIKQNDKVVANYDRGWDVRPQTKEAKMALDFIMKDYN